MQIKPTYIKKRKVSSLSKLDTNQKVALYQPKQVGTFVMYKYIISETNNTFIINCITIKLKNFFSNFLISITTFQKGQNPLEKTVSTNTRYFLNVYNNILKIVCK